MDSIKSLLSTDELIEPTSPAYTKEIWAAQKDLKPELVARPASVESLSSLLAALDNTGLEFAIRCGGCGSASAKDVLISLSAFDGFEFNKENETITIGAGQVWGEVDRKMEEFAPGYATISARCTYVGVGGGALQGGIGWLSSEYGLASDPHNMPDAQIVKMNGQVLWASEEPNLLWALRGGGGNFGAVTALKMKTYRYPTSVYSGLVAYPRDALATLAKAIPDFIGRCNDPKMAMHFYCLDLSQGSFIGQAPQPGIAIAVYDGNGEEHGRSDAGFKWALDIEGAVDMSKSMTVRQVAQQFDSLENTRGLTNQMMSAVTIPSIDEKLILKTWKWYDDLLKKDPHQGVGAFVLIEIMQKAAFHSIKSPSDSAWPHTKNQHILQLGTGAMKGCPPEAHAIAVKALAEAPWQICENFSPADILPRDFESFHEPDKVSHSSHSKSQKLSKVDFWGDFEKMKQVKKVVDPKGRIKGAYSL